MTTQLSLARDRIDWICSSEPDERNLRIRVVAELQRAIGFDAHVWLLTDPDTCVGTDPLAGVPSLGDLPQLIRLKYTTGINRWTAIPTSRAVTLEQATGGDLSRSRAWRVLLSNYGVSDVASMVFRDAYGCWGFLDLWRIGGSFTATEQSLLTDVIPQLTTSVRTGIARTFQPGSGAGAAAADDGPVVMMLSPDLQILAQTPQTDAYLRRLLPPPGGLVSPVPAAAYNVAAQLLAAEEGIDDGMPKARVHLAHGRWLTLRAARIPGGDSTPGPIAVTIETTGIVDRAEIFSAASGLSRRESELLLSMLDGEDTHILAQRLHLSEYTIQDHLKSIFTKTGTRTRRSLIARALGSH